MPRPIALALLLAAALRAQNGQQGARANWPCVPGRAVDPSYLDISESTGGQLVLFQKGEAAHASPVMSAPYTHPATILRLVGHLNGPRDLEFPVDSTVRSLLFLVSVQCRERILVLRPSGAEVSQRTAPLALELASSSIFRVDDPEPGQWKLRLAGSGLFVASVLAKSEISLYDVALAPDGAALSIRVAGPAARIAARFVDAAGARVGEPSLEPLDERNNFRISTPHSQRYRLVVTGDDGSAWSFQRTHPVLFRAR